MGWSMEPEAMVAEPEAMTGVVGGARVYGVRHNGYNRSYGVEPEAMV